MMILKDGLKETATRKRGEKDERERKKDSLKKNCN
jgi:hypothetical protein